MDQYSSYIHASRYARWIESEGRRENWQETVDRYITFFKDRNKDIKGIPWDELRQAIHDHEIMPSMRAMMTAGRALERDNVAGFNCSYVACDHPRVFDEIMYILMCGTGVGFSVERQFVNDLPEVPDEIWADETTIVVSDSKLGWAKAYKQLIGMLYNGDLPKWDLSRIRPAGERLKTFGGRASGPEPLEDLFNFTVDKFNPGRKNGDINKGLGRRLNSIECHDIICKIADIVVCGGVRRCLPADTPVFTVDGVKAIKDIRVGDFIITGGETAKVIAAGTSGKKETIVIKHRFGEIECTPEHHVAVFNSIMEYDFKPAKDIIIGDRLVWDSVGYDGSDTFLPILNTDTHFNSKLVKIPSLTTDVAWLIGLIHGDGYVGNGSIEISGNMKDIHILQRAKDILESQFELSGVTCGSDGQKGIGARVRVRSADLCRWFLKHIKQSNTSIMIPPFVMNANRDIRFAYLSGLLDADGHLRKDGGIEQCTTIYKDFALQVVTLLASLGISSPSKFTSGQPRRDAGVRAKDSWTISVIGRTNRINFHDGVKNFCEKIKTAGMDQVKGGPVDFSFPVGWTGRTGGYRPHGNINVDAIRYNLPLLPTRVTGIKSGKVVDTYDIEIEGIKRFTANGIVVHNSALISLSNLTDERMQRAKHGNFAATDPQRQLANNSVCYTEPPDMGIWMREWQALSESKSGERGIFSRPACKSMSPERRDTNYEFGTNPCAEIILRSKQFCNLSEVVIRFGDTLDTLKRKVRLATILGTLQATLTDFRYLSPAWKKNTIDERLLGVSLTGMMDHATLSTTNGHMQSWLRQMKETAVATNEEFAELLGISMAAAITCVKPSGTVSQLTNSASGIHPRYSKFYTRTVRHDKKDPLSDWMIDHGFPHEEEHRLDGSPSTNWIFSFPVRGPSESVYRNDMSALDQLEHWKVVAKNWCEHKPSITVYVREREWMDVGAWVYKNFDIMSGVAFLPYDGGTYRQAPYTEIDEKAYHEDVTTIPTDVVFSDYRETEDHTEGSQMLACVGGSCEI